MNDFFTAIAISILSKILISLIYRPMVKKTNYADRMSDFIPTKLFGQHNKNDIYYGYISSIWLIIYYYEDIKHLVGLI